MKGEFDMSIQSAYDEILEDTQCPNCGCVGMLPNGSFDYCCPNCDYEGSLEDD
jgi:uncharacterized Zn finger protein (UPF0148 family)